MLKKFKNQINNEKGLTLIELLAVIVILAIIAAIAVPAIGNVINNSKDRAILAETSNILSGAKIAMTDGACGGAGGTTTPTICELGELSDYVEGIKSGTYQAEKKTTGWEVTYSKLGDINNSKYQPTSNTVTETNLNVLLAK